MTPIVYYLEALAIVVGAAVTPIITYILTRKKLLEIHVLVNSRLQAALREVELLEARLSQVKDQLTGK